MHTSDIFILFVLFSCFSLNDGYYRRSRKDCFIPRGALYDRASFRLQYGNDIGQLARGQPVRQYMRVVIVCNLEMLSDMILDYHIVTCHRGRWKPRMPRCEEPKSCKPPRSVENTTSRVLLGNDVDYPDGTILRYMCKSGYDLEGDKNERHCYNGKWDDVNFICKKRQKLLGCSTGAIAIPNAYIVIRGEENTADKYPHGTHAEYRCFTGFIMAGNNTTICDNGTWQVAAMACTPKPPACNRMAIANGEIVAVKSSGKHKLRCHKGFWVKGNKVMNCINGAWSMPIPSCVVRFCKVPQRNGRYYTDFSTGRMVVGRIASQVKVVQHCMFGYRKKSISTCVNGRWRPNFKHCYGKRQPRARSQTGNCVVPDDPLATYFNETNHTIGLLAIVRDGGHLTQLCIHDNRGAGFNELNSSYCTGGRWIPELQNCPNKSTHQEHCIKPVIMDAAFVPERDFYQVNEIVQVKCHDNEVEQLFIKCFENGLWSANVSCKVYQSELEDERKCKREDIVGATVIPDSNFYYVHEEVQVQCFNDKKRSKIENITCLESGVWSTNISCIVYQSDLEDERKCKREDIVGAIVIPDSKFYYVKEEVQVQCSNDKKRSKIENLTCLESGVWSTNISCKVYQSDLEDERKCKREDIVGAIVIPDSKFYYVKEEVQVQCSNDKKRSKIENLTCLESGVWSTNISCKAGEQLIHCAPPQKSNLVFWPLKQSYNFNENITILTCADGLVKAGSFSMRCSGDGSWEGDFECLPSCGNGRLNVTDTKFNYFDKTLVDSEAKGWLSSIDECAKLCVNSRNFLCKAIQIFDGVNGESLQFYCKILSTVADSTSESFISHQDAVSKIYNIGCNTTCGVPAEPGMVLKDIQDKPINQTVDDGTTLSIECTEKGKYPRSHTVTCVAGQWNLKQTFCRQLT